MRGPVLGPGDPAMNETDGVQATCPGLYITLLKPLLACADHFFLSQSCLEQIIFVLRLKRIPYVQCLAQCLKYGRSSVTAIALCLSILSK